MPWESNLCITYSARVPVALGIQHAMHMRHTVISGLPCSTIFVFTLSHKRQYFRKKKFMKHKMCFDFLYNFFGNISHSKKNGTSYDKKSIVVFM